MTIENTFKAVKAAFPWAYSITARETEVVVVKNGITIHVYPSGKASVFYKEPNTDGEIYKKIKNLLYAGDTASAAKLAGEIGEMLHNVKYYISRTQEYEMALYRKNYLLEVVLPTIKKLQED